MGRLPAKEKIDNQNFGKGYKKAVLLTQLLLIVYNKIYILLYVNLDECVFIYFLIVLFFDIRRCRHG